MSDIELFDLTIIGGGPAGLYSAFYGGLREMKTKIIEAQPELGGKIHVYPEKIIWDVGGLVPITGAKLIEQLKEQALTFNPEVILNEKVTSISRSDEGWFVLKAASSTIHYSKSVIIAIGSGILQPLKLALEGADRYEVTNLHYTVQSIKHFKDKTVVISGGGNSAIDWANLLEPIAAKVYLVHRRDSLSGHESQVSQLLNSSANCMFNSSITKLIPCPKEPSIESVEVTNHLTEDITTIPVDDVLIHHGFDRDASLLEDSELDIPMVDEFYIKGNATSETAIPGLYAAGDILKHDGKLHLIAGAFQDAANAVNKAKKFIEPLSEASAMVSSHNEVFYNRNKELIMKMIK
ncbi:NAD(P)/FAD-dependent oxidoreductase [Neobacillus sp. LXY-1]|uniref:NAD(P)/FAD-dependent oxidoreductase n=1 Tax=Neobacillus sp. LXY-1 TaxID=3379133 RepID=UPI003EE215D5